MQALIFSSFAGQLQALVLCIEAWDAETVQQWFATMCVYSFLAVFENADTF